MAFLSGDLALSGAAKMLYTELRRIARRRTCDWQRRAAYCLVN